MRCIELFRQIHLCYENECNRMLAEYDLTFAQLELLHFLFMQQEKGVAVNQRRIEETLRLKNPTVTGLLNRLESKAFIVRVADAQDRRANIILLTDKAHRLRDEVSAAAEAKEDQLLQGFSDEERRRLEKMLEKMQMNISGKS